MTDAASSFEPNLQARARDLFLLERAERAVRAFTPEQHAAVRKHFDAAQRRASVADDLSDDRNVAVAYVLYREAVTLLIAAVLASRDASRTDLDDLRASTAFDALTELAAAGRIPPLPEYVGQARKLLSEDEPLAFDRRAPEDLLSRRKSVEFTLRWLQELIEPRTLNEIRATRLVRLFITAALIACMIGWIVVRVTRPVNIALNKPVTISQRHPASTAPADNSGIVNGDIEGSYGAHTAPAAAGSFAWVMVDLVQPTSIKKVKVFNRADGWFDESLPWTIEFSDDGTTFNPVDTRTTGFTARSPWIYEAKGVKTRFVRVRSNSYLALTEIEINP
ncbi:MAG TPA: discoidin domain-containing protein [Polyangiaceae bacterium]|nr:discoidin domain-containing protein [Polyangiaceae bacterium]